MTKLEHETLQKFINRIRNIRERQDEIFDFLLEENRKNGTGHAWCCAYENYKDLKACGKDYTYKYECYVKCGAQYDLLTELGQELAELKFWKK